MNRRNKMDKEFIPIDWIDRDVLNLLKMKNLWAIMNDWSDFSLYDLFIRIKKFDKRFDIILRGFYTNEFFVEKISVDNEYNCLLEYSSPCETHSLMYQLKRMFTNKEFKKKLLTKILTEGE